MWARSLGRHMFMSGMFSLDQWDSGADYLVLDDVDWKWLPSKKQLLGAQKQFTMADKYTRKRTVVWGKPSIYCMNNDNYILMTQDPIWAWVQGNCTLIFLENKLY